MPLATAVEAHTYLGKLIMPNDAACTAWRVQVSAARCQQLVVGVHAETHRAGSNIPFQCAVGEPKEAADLGPALLSSGGHFPFRKETFHTSADLQLLGPDLLRAWKVRSPIRKMLPRHRLC